MGRINKYDQPKRFPNNVTIDTTLVLLKGYLSPVEIDVGQSCYTSGKFNLHRLKLILKDNFSELKGIGPSKIEFFNIDDQTTPLKSGMVLTSDTTTDKKPLVICYPLLKSSIKANLIYYLYKGEYNIQHSSGSFALL